ncbi:MAG TPA: undecaprenyl/decaprenyl-phosphate alpha-N-acetylglucosaminyl 1-phosphate transferase, partial [Chloroflexi bacterium]|nr:undecaprenyl/decaprenyl-phosphate alpha-N-acetylglucosaminyl 1-phosphate transferase [Chloroflexota bacterium]
MDTFLLVPLLALVITVVTTPVTMWLARRWQLDHPPTRPRDVHTRAVPRSGGMAMVAGFVAAVGLGLALPVARTDPLELTRVAGLLLGSVV